MCRLISDIWIVITHSQGHRVFNKDKYVKYSLNLPGMKKNECNNSPDLQMCRKHWTLSARVNPFTNNFPLAFTRQPGQPKVSHLTNPGHPSQDQGWPGWQGVKAWKLCVNLHVNPVNLKTTKYRCTFISNEVILKISNDRIQRLSILLND